MENELRSVAQNALMPVNLEEMPTDRKIWRIEWQDHRPKLDVEGPTERRTVMTDIMFGMLFFESDTSAKEEIKFYFRYQGRPIHLGERELTKIIFVPGKSPQLAIEVDGKLLPNACILRFCLYSRTDDGVLIIAFYPRYAEDAPPLTILLSRKKRVNRLVRHLCVPWMYEIIRATR